MSAPANSVHTRALRHLHQRQRVALDESAEVHLLESGALALAAAGSDDLPQRVLARMGPGSALVSAPGLRSARRRLIALAPGEAALRSLPFEPWWASRRDRRSQVCRQVAAWAERLARLVRDDAAPRVAVRVGGALPAELALADGQALCARPRSVVWVEALEGRLACLDDERLVLAAGTGPTPLAADLWLRARGAARVRVLALQEIDDAQVVLAGLARLGAFALERADARDERERDAERERLRRRERRSDQDVDAALAGLASVLRPRAEPLVGDDLLRAMTVIGRSLGVAIVPPAGSEVPGRAQDALAAIARASHLRVRRVRLTGRWWRRDCGSLLGFTADAGRRPCALLPRRRGGYVRVDPDGSRARVDRRAAARLESWAFQVHRPLPPGRLDVLLLLRFALAGRGRDFAWALLLVAAATLLGMVTPLATRSLMDHAIPDADRGRLVELGLALGAAALGVALFDLAAGWLLQRIGTRMEADTQTALWDRVLRLRPNFFRRFSSGDLQARVTAVDEIGRALGGNVVAGAFSALLALSNLALLFHYSARLAWLGVALALVVLCVSTGVGVLLQRSLARLVAAQGHLFGFVVQLLDGIAKLRVAGAEKRAYARWLREYAGQLALWSRVHRGADALSLLAQIVPQLGLGLLLLLSLEELEAARSSAAGGGLSLGAFLAFNTAFATFLAAASSLSDLCVEGIELWARAARVRPILDEEPEVDVGKADPGRLTGKLSVASLSFGYPGGAQALERVELEVEPGELVALVGPSGSGKSTLFRLLLGFEVPDAGTVRYDDQDLGTLDVHAVRRQIGVVLQGGTPEAGSIFENIAGGSALTLDEAWAAAEDAGLADDVRRMPMGMHTLVSVGGANLSGGQRQRLLIARALAMHPRVLLLDEATSALDNRTQEQISVALERLRITRLVIAHRLSTVRRADRILVLERGRVVQSGTFEELARAPGRFATLMRRQLV